jgi:hypothetical protein
MLEGMIVKKLMLVATLAAISACSKPEPAAAPDATTDTAAAPAPTPTTVAADGKPSVGKFQVTGSDGKVSVEEVKADGTYTDTQDGKVVETGTWRQESPAVWCWTNDKAGSKEVCSDEKVENGVYTSTNRETKKSSTVVRLES